MLKNTLDDNVALPPPHSLLGIDKEKPDVMGRLLRRVKTIQAVNKMKIAQILMNIQMRCLRKFLKV